MIFDISFSFSPKILALSSQKVLAQDTTTSTPSKEFQDLESKSFGKDAEGKTIALQDKSTINTLAQTFYIYLSRLVLLASILAGIIGGYMYMYSSGDPKKIQTAKDIIYSALLGIIAVAFAYTFFNVMLPPPPVTPPTP